MDEMRPDLVVDVPLDLPQDSQPLPVRICEGVRGLIMDGVLAPGDHLPSGPGGPCAKSQGLVRPTRGVTRRGRRLLRTAGG